MYTITKAAAKDSEIIHNLAKQVWEPTYGNILSVEQLKYMFELMYSIESLNRQMEDGHVYYIAYRKGKPVGYVSVEKENESRFHLQKLYILPSEQGNGLGRLLIDKIKEHVKIERPEGDLTLVLNVNRENKAKLFYEKLGFYVESQGDFEIGNGFYMNDYIMALDV